jgi:gamma-glutamyl:cysteine ligase YbdK (ATP-grasp superfamily)
VIEQHFGSSLTVGVEEELWILDAETLELVPAVEQIVTGAEGRALPGVLKTELHASVVELASDISQTADEAVERLVELRQAAHSVARANGFLSDQHPRRAADRARRALPRLRCVRRLERATTGGQRLARARRHA